MLNVNAGIEGDFYMPEITEVSPAISHQQGHNHTFGAACNIARDCGGDFDQFVKWMTDWNETCEPPWSEYELDHKIRDAWAEVYGERVNGEKIKGEPLPRAKKRKLNLRAINKLAKGAYGQYQKFLDDVKNLPIPPLENLIDRLYPGNPLICSASQKQWWAHTFPRENLRGIEKEREWIVPSPMSKGTGVTKSGKTGSHRCRDNAGPRIYIIVDFDLSETVGLGESIAQWAEDGISIWDVQVVLITHLATTGNPRAWPFMVVHTGGKSLHCWYQISSLFPESMALEFLSRAIPLGADKRAEQPEQLFRFPGGTRKSDKGQPQTILFYDPAKLVS
jgi:hypothetical protein